MSEEGMPEELIGKGPTGKVPASKAEVVKKFKRKEGDTGSPEVQVAILTHRLEHQLDLTRLPGHR